MSAQSIPSLNDGAPWRSSRRTRLGILTIGLVAAMTLLPMGGAFAAEPLPTGSYDLVLDEAAITVSVAEDGTPTVVTSDGVVVTLNYDDQGRVLDVVRVTSGDDTWDVALDVADDGSYTQTITPVEREAVEEDEGLEAAVDDEEADDDEADDDEADDDEVDDDGHGELVSMVAKCAPNGNVAKAAGWPNHGTIVRAAASGAPLVASITDPETGETTAIEADLSTLEGAEAFCAFVADSVPTKDEAKAAMKAERDEAKTQRDADKDAAKAERDAAKDASKAERAKDDEAGDDGSDDEADDESDDESDEEDDDEPDDEDDDESKGKSQDKKGKDTKGKKADR